MCTVSVLNLIFTYFVLAYWSSLLRFGWLYIFSSAFLPKGRTWRFAVRLSRCIVYVYLQNNHTYICVTPLDSVAYHSTLFDTKAVFGGAFAQCEQLSATTRTSVRKRKQASSFTSTHFVNCCTVVRSPVMITSFCNYIYVAVYVDLMLSRMPLALDDICASSNPGHNYMPVQYTTKHILSRTKR